MKPVYSWGSFRKHPIVFLVSIPTSWGDNRECASGLLMFQLYADLFTYGSAVRRNTVIVHTRFSINRNIAGCLPATEAS